MTIPECVLGTLSDTFPDSENLQQVEIADGVESIKADAFSGCSGLTSVKIPDSVTSIGDFAFSDCSGLTSVIIPDSVASIGDFAFNGCSGLTSVTIPNSVTSIGNHAFFECSKLTSVAIPKSVESIGIGAFAGCRSLTSVTIPDSVTSIGDYAFFGCSKLTSVTIPDGVTSIGKSAFSGCTGLTSVTIPNSVTSIGAGAFDSTALATVFVDPGDTDRVKGLLEGSGVAVGDLTFVEVGLTALEVTPIAPFGVAIDYTYTMMPGETADYAPVITATTVNDDSFKMVYTEKTLTEVQSLGENKYRVYWNMAKDGVPSLVNATIAVKMKEVLSEESTATPKESNTLKFGNVTASVIADGARVTDTITLEAVPFEGEVATVMADGLTVLVEAEDEAKSATYRPTANGAHTIEYVVAETAALTVMSVTYNFNLPPLTVSDVSVQTIKPFGLAIDYTVDNVMAGAEGYVPEVTLTLVNKHVAKTLTGDISMTEGKHRLYWNLAKDGIESFEGGVISVTYVKAPYCVIDLSGGANADSYPVTYLACEPEGGFNTDEYKKDKLVLKRVDAGSFIMGEDQFLTVHEVTLTKPFYLALFETTQRQWELVMGTNPSYNTTDYERKPVEQVSYGMIRGSSDDANWPTGNKVDADSFLGRLRAKTGNLAFDLPTEAQWEYACRAGTMTTYNLGDTEEYLENAGWYIANSTNTTHDVGGKTPNAWGLYDMHGNVLEWCLDWRSDALAYGSDPAGAESGAERVVRGGGWANRPDHSTSSIRLGIDPSAIFADLGFRLTRTLEGVATPVTPATFWPVSATVLTSGSKVSETLKIDCAPFEGADVTVTVNGAAVEPTDGSYAWLPNKVGTNEIVYTIDGNTFTVAYDAVERAPVITDVKVAKIAPFGVAVDYTYTMMENATTAYTPVITAKDGSTVYTAKTLSAPQSQSASENKYRVYWNMAKDGVPSLAGATVSVTLKEKLSDYCVVDLPDLPDDAGAVAALSYDIAWTDDVPTDGYNKNEYKTAKLVLKRINAGEFIMGEEQDNDGHCVTLTQPFYMALFETTQSQWQRVTGSNPSQFQPGVFFDVSDDCSKRPVEMVSYNDIRGSINGAKWPADKDVDDDSFLGKLRARTGDLAFDLPTEAQWEYACRAGTTTKWSFGKDVSDADSYMWYYDNSRNDDYVFGATQDVGGKEPNAWGLYDMHGNVCELCLDWYDELTYGVDPVGVTTGSRRVVRGGSFRLPSDDCTSASRKDCSKGAVGEDLGFRLALPVEQKVSKTYEVPDVTTSVIVGGTTVKEAIDFGYLGEEGASVSIIQTAEGGAGDKTEIVGNKTSVGTQSWQPTKPDDYKYEYLVGGTAVLSATYKMWNIPMSFSDEILQSFNYEGVYDGQEHGIALTNGCDALKGIKGATVTYRPVSGDVSAEDYMVANPTFKNAIVNMVWYRITAPGYAPYDGSAIVAISPRPVTLQSDTKEDFVYDGEAHEFPVLVKSGNWFVAGEGIATSNWATVTNVSDGEDGVVENTFTYTFNEGTLETNYDITVKYGEIAVQPLDISGEGEWVCHLDETHIYDGTEWTQEVVSATFKGLPVTFDVKDNKQTNAGTYELTLTGKGNFTGTRKIAWSIGRRQLVLTAADGEKVYDGTPLKEDGVTANEGGFVDGEGATYVLNNSQTKFGESKNVISDINWNEGTSASNYDVTTRDGTLTVTKRKVKITSGTAELVYNGKAQTFEEITIEAVEADGVGFVAGEGIVTSNWATVTIVADGEVANKFDYAPEDGTDLDNYEITVAFGTIKVVPKELTEEMFSLLNVPTDGYVWDGNAKKPDVSCQDGSPSIIGNDDFTVAYTNNTDVGTATVTFTGQNNYTGTAEKRFTIGELYADVTFDALGGKIGAENAVKLEQKHRVYNNLPSDPTRENYTFEGWYLDVADDATEATADGAWLAEGEHTLYARWAVDSAVLPDAADGVLAYEDNLDGTVTITGLGDIPLTGTSLVIPDMIDGKYVTEIAAGAFANSTKGITSVTLPMFLKKIGRRAFSGIKTLASVTFASVREWSDPSEAGTLVIDPYAFTSTALTSVRLPVEVGVVGDYAFADCRSLTEVTILGEPTVGTRPFRRAGIDAGVTPTVRLKEALADNTAYLATITQGVEDAVVRTDAVVESVSVGTISVTPRAVSLSVAVGRASDWGEVDTSRLRVEYRESLGDAPTTLTPSAVTPQADGTLAVEVAAPEGASGFFRVKVEE